MACMNDSDVERQLSTSEFSEELEFLENIYFDDLTMLSCDQAVHKLVCHVTPSTGADTDKQFVFLDLQITIPKEYPAEVPLFVIAQSRGLSDPHLNTIIEGLASRSCDLVGTSMLYELIEWARETLTVNNLPSEDCSICLLPFSDDDQFMKTECYHYYHLPCIAGYIQFYQKQVIEKELEDSKFDRLLRKETKQLECPVCRLPMATPSLPPTLSHDWSRDLSSDEKRFVPSDNLRAWQMQMEVLLWRQRQKGGVIENNDDDVIDSTWVSSVVIKPKSESSLSVKDPIPIQKSPRAERKTPQNRAVASDEHPGSRSYSVGKKTNSSRARSAGSFGNQSSGNHSNQFENSKCRPKTVSMSKFNQKMTVISSEVKSQRERKSAGSICDK